MSMSIWNINDYSNIDKYNDHLLILADAWGKVGLCSLCNPRSGLWSVIS